MSARPRGLHIMSSCHLLAVAPATLPPSSSNIHKSACKSCGVVTSQRCFSEIPRGGAELLSAKSADGRRKIVLDASMPTGFDVMGMLDHAKDFVDDNDETNSKSDILHMNGSILAFPHSCFLWKVGSPREVTLETLSLVVLRDPKVEFLFIGCNSPLPPRELNRIKKAMKERGVVVDQMDLVSTFLG